MGAIAASLVAKAGIGMSSIDLSSGIETRVKIFIELIFTLMGEPGLGKRKRHRCVDARSLWLDYRNDQIRHFFGVTLPRC